MKEKWKINVLLSTCMISVIPFFGFDNYLETSYNYIDIEIKDLYMTLTEAINKASFMYNRALYNCNNYFLIPYIINNNHLDLLDIKTLLCNYTIIELTLKNIICLIEVDPSLIDPAILNDSSPSGNSSNDNSSNPINPGPSGTNNSSNPGNSGGASGSNSNNPDSNKPNSNNSSSNNPNPRPNNSNSGNPSPNNPNIGNPSLNNSDPGNPSSSNPNSNNPGYSDNTNNETENSSSKKRKLPRMESRQEAYKRLCREVADKAITWEDKARTRGDYYDRWLARVQQLRQNSTNIDRGGYINEYQACYNSEEYKRIMAEQEAAKEDVTETDRLRKNKSNCYKQDWVNHFTIRRLYDDKQDLLKVEFNKLQEEIEKNNRNR